MPNTRLLLDLFIAAVAIITPFIASTIPVTRVSELKGRSSPMASRRGKTIGSSLHAREGRSVHTPIYTVTATVYEAVLGQTDDEPFVTADNSRIKPHYGSKKRWMALSRDLLKPWDGKFKYGDMVEVRGISVELDGVYTVHDTMNRRHRHCMDVLVHPSEHFDGLWKDVKIRKVSE